ncbi:MAG: cytochrome P450 [Aeromicrobium sp.]
MLELRSRVSSLAGRLATRALSRGSVDLGQLTIVPERAKFPLRRHGTDPVAKIAEVRAAGPLHELKLPFGMRAWLVTGYAESREVLTDTGSYSNDIRHLFSGSGPTTGDDIGGLGFTDPPLHTKLRKIITPEFTMRRLARMEPIIRDIVERQLDELAAGGPGADLAKHVAFPVPFQTITSLLGMAYEDAATFQRLGGARFDVTGGAAAFGAMSAQREFLFAAVAKQRLDPGPGLIGQIIRDEGDNLTDAELAGLADGVFTGGFETTAGMIALGTLVLLRDPGHAALVRDGSPDEVDTVVEELLRYLSVVQLAFPRFAKQDMQLFGRTIRKGDVLLASLPGADRDPRVMGANAEEFDPFRVPSSGHLAFGHGIHRCIGAELARIELRIVLPRIFQRFPDLALAVPGSDIAFRQLSFVYGVDSLPVTF